MAGSGVPRRAEAADRVGLAVTEKNEHQYLAKGAADARAILCLACIAGGVAATAARATPPAGTVTYSKQVARIMQARCESPPADGVLLSALGDYRQARKWG